MGSDVLAHLERAGGASVVTRFAPTPSGFLHAGNVVNALLTSWLARQHRGRMLLRIDDFDTARLRDRYVEDIFDTIQWLGLPVAGGPSDAAQWAQRRSLAHGRDRLVRARDELWELHPDLVFVCRCSRRDLLGGFCVRGCAARGHRLRPGESALRLHVPRGTTVAMRIVGELGGLPLAPAESPTGEQGSESVRALAGARRLGTEVSAGDHVIWRRDDLAAYHLASVVLDEGLGVTAIVRGMDLAASSSLQVHLARLLTARGPAAATYLHHGLLTGPDGSKLSKSAGIQSAPLPRDGALRGRLMRAAQALGAPLGIGAPPDEG